ncbi:MAG: DUF2244 domain-containing protein [Proteobacteria bacterium]|nr:DUF2244 domain-containing protein [Pseudomonadota bacterium]MDA1332028.1 DUF2244 domain-containing protein [Pseudomonadota bacterium]
MKDSNGLTILSNAEILMRRPDVARSSVATVFLLLGAVTVSIAIGFATQGLWLVLPFASLECVALGVAYWWLKKQSDDYDLIRIDGDQIVFESSFSGMYQKSSFNRYWLHVSLEQTSSNYLKVCVGSHGERVEVGRLLSAAGKRDLAKQIQMLILR